jgi:hypothetical protein
MRGHSHLKEEVLDRTMWRARFGRVFGPVVRQTTEWMMNIWNVTRLQPRYSCTSEKHRVITTRLQTIRKSPSHAKTTLQSLCDSDYTKNGGYDPPRLQLHFWFSLEGYILWPQWYQSKELYANRMSWLSASYARIRNSVRRPDNLTSVLNTVPQSLPSNSETQPYLNVRHDR